MKITLKITSFVALAGALIAPIAFFADALAIDAAQGLLLAGAVLWFATAPFWMEHKAAD